MRAMRRLICAVADTAKTSEISGAAFSPSGLQQAMLSLSRATSLFHATHRAFALTAECGRAAAQLGVWSQQGRLPSFASRGLVDSSALCKPLLPSSLAHVRSLFGAAQAKKVNPQIHTHDKYKLDNPQPKNA
jgi:hypothetical protein